MLFYEVFIKVLSDGGVLDEKMEVCDNRQDLLFVYLWEKGVYIFSKRYIIPFYYRQIVYQMGSYIFMEMGVKGRYRLK